MDRRSFLVFAGATAAVALPGPGRRQARATPMPAASASGWRRFEITTEVNLADNKGPAQLWLPLAQTAGGYQRAFDLAADSTGGVERVRDARYGADILRVTWKTAGPQSVRLVQTVATRPRGPEPMQPLPEADRQFWLQGTASVPTDGIVRRTAERIVAGKTGERERLRAIYDWVVDNTFRDGAARGCGVGNIKNMLETGWLGGKCADINSLMVGLSRAAGIPARDVYGIRIAPSAFNPHLGASGDITKAQHCRAEMWLSDTGWFPVDPADVRKVVLEGKLPLNNPEVRAERERLFGNWEMNWAGYNSATDIALPGAPHPMAQNFLLYPCAMTTAGQPDCLDPKSFSYRIAAREVMA